MNSLGMHEHVTLMHPDARNPTARVLLRTDKDQQRWPVQIERYERLGEVWWSHPEAS
jgi:hypothetical protein